MILKPPYIFYFKTTDKCFVYNTYSHKLSVFNDSAFIILESFKTTTFIEKEALIEKIKKQNSSLDFNENDVSESIDFLVSCDVLVSTNQPSSFFEEQCIKESVSNGSLYSVLFELTYKCNEKCKYCYIDNSNEKELSTSEVFHILESLRDFGVFNIVFTGGEVFVRPDFIEIFNKAIDLGFLVDIYTNGICCTDSRIVDIARRHPRSIQFSLYSADSAIHDSFTQVNGSFEKTIGAAKKFIDLGVAVNFKINMLNFNCDEIVDMIDYCNSLGATVQVGTIVKENRSGDISPYQYKMDETQYRRFLPLVFDKLNKASDVNVSARDKNAAICGAGITSVSISPYGKVYVCNSFHYEIGDLRVSSFKEVMTSSQKLKDWKQRRWASVTGCSECAKASVCSFCPGLAYEENKKQVSKYSGGCFLTDITIEYINSRKGGE